ncbi:glycoside hydrolase family 6 protein [Nocardioides solisilvae]|uniref:glycoside hydrolase family 6 protein n=1 Tax=Nocardioides solisilvae TaxID=1542435 RepID=UPI0013A5AF50|nr:glycoside hydrolase family 6 protein [Nocardioides solisilvae]
MPFRPLTRDRKLRRRLAALALSVVTAAASAPAPGLSPALVHATDSLASQAPASRAGGSGGSASASVSGGVGGDILARVVRKAARKAAKKAAKRAAAEKARKQAAKRKKRKAALATAAAANPLAGHPMGVYKGPGDQAWPPYERSSGETRELLAKIALRPKAKWFGAWIPDGRIRSTVQDYVANSTGGDPDVLVQMAVFRMVPWEHEACRRLPTPAEQASYKFWIDEFAAGVGSAHAAIVLQPDGPFALCAPGGSRLPSELIKYAATRFAALPNTSVYIDAGAADWPKDDPAQAAEILVRAGVDRVRGFALNSTHYVALADDVAFGTQVVAELARRGIPGKHFVVNTSSNGRGFEFNLGRGNHPDNANVCRTPEERVCVTLGIPPTTDVANPRWGLGPELTAAAAEHVDAYLWFGRPWLNMQNDPFVMDRALAMARTTPW